MMTLADLHEYQKRTANFLAQHPRAIISVDMGLGKTAAVLAWLDWWHKRHPRDVYGLPSKVLIIAPKRVAENNWLQEAQKWGLMELCNLMTICCGTAQKRAKNWRDASKPIKICSRDNFKDYANAKCDVLIIDELTSYKSPDAMRSRAVQSVNALLRIGLTGTFLANGAIDIYGQAAAVGLAERFGAHNFYAWRATYFRDVLAGAGLAFQKWRLNVPLVELLKPIQDCIFTLTAKDYLRIPAVTHNTHEIAMSAEVRAAIDELDAFLSARVGDEVLTFTEQQKFAKLQTLCNGFVYTDEGAPVRSERSAKLEAVADFVADCKDTGEPVLLFYAFREERAWLLELLKERKVKAIDVRDDAKFLDRWNEHEIDCLLAHPASAGHGLNLQHGGRVIVWSTLTYNYELFAQGNARLARQGQTRNVQVHYFVAEHTCEEQAVRALRNKQNEQNEFLKLTKQ